MTFLNPLLLFGTAAVAAPIVIHMLMNRRVHPVAWAAMRFLRTSVQRNRKRRNIEDILLLLLRCFLLALLALALARPALRGAGGAGGIGKGSETAVIALDNSYSMGRTDGGPTRFDQARQAAEQVIDSLQGGSSVAVLLFSDTVRGVIPEPTFDLNLARKIVRDAQISDRATDVQPALQQALETLRPHSGVREIYCITDGQANGWKRLDDKVLRDPAARTNILLIGGAEQNNLCVSDLQMAGSMASLGEAAQFDVEVTNSGAADAKDVTVRLRLDDDPPSDEGVLASIPPGGAKRVSLFTKFRAAGYHTVTAELEPDHLPADDRRTIAVRARDDVRVLLVSGDTGGDASEDATFYLRHALTPVPAADLEKYFIKTATVLPAGIEPARLGDYDAVILADVPRVATPAADALAAYVSRGGGLILFPGPKTDAAFYNDNFGKRLGLLPALLGGIRGKPGEPVFSLQATGYTHRIVSIWNDPASGTLASAQFRSAFELKPFAAHPPQAGEPGVVLKYADGSPAVMERTFGLGRVILFSSTANTAWNDLPLRPAYLPLVDRTLGSILDRAGARLNIPVGGVFRWVCDPDWTNKDALITTPGEKEASLRRINMVDGTPTLRFDETERAGAYGVSVKSDPPGVLKFAAQFNPEESNLAGLAPSQLASLAAAAKVIHWEPGARLGEGTAGGGGGRELWTALIILLLAAACAESLLGAFFSESR